MAVLCFKNARIVYPDNVKEQEKLFVYNGKIISENDLGTGLVKTDIEAQGKFILPGLIDTHVHGAGGADTMDATPKSLLTISKTLAKFGTTAFLPTTMSATKEKVCMAIQNVTNSKEQQQKSFFEGAEILGVHMEGPLIALKYKGAQAKEVILEDEAEKNLSFINYIFQNCKAEDLLVITLAIERLGVEAVIKMCCEKNVIISVGHTEAKYEDMCKAVKMGVSSLTHAFNAMPGIHHREPGILTAALLSSKVNMELIADAVHVHPAVLEMVLNCKSEDGVCIISDGTRAVGMPEGEYELGGQKIFVKDGAAKLCDGTIAGSALSLIEGVKVLYKKVGLNLSQAVRYATINPAKKMGLSHRLGSLEIGKDADLFLADDFLNVERVWLKGKEFLF